MNNFLNTTIESNEELVIYPELEQTNDPEVFVPTLDFTLLDLEDKEAFYGKGGVKQYHEHWYGDKKAIRREFNYTNDGVWIDFYWYTNDGSIGIHKKKFKPLNPHKMEGKKRNDRLRTLDYLRSKARGTTLEPVIKIIFDHFSTEIDSYEKNGDQDFFNALATYSGSLDSYVNAVTTIPHPSESRNLTVKEIILYEIS